MVLRIVWAKGSKYWGRLAVKSTRQWILRKQASPQSKKCCLQVTLKEKDSIEAKNEVEKYLAKLCIDVDDDFNVLEWWKVNSSKFPIFSMIARDIIAVLVSTVASEFIFSIGR